MEFKTATMIDKIDNPQKLYTKVKVCTACLCPSIKYISCQCVTENNYDTVELEFECCPCCGVMSDQPAKTEFNKMQLLTIFPDYKDEEDFEDAK